MERSATRSAARSAIAGRTMAAATIRGMLPISFRRDARKNERLDERS